MRFPILLRRRRVLAIALAALASLLAVGTWFVSSFLAPSQHADSHSSVRTYNRIGALAAASDVVVMGDVTRIVSGQPDIGASSDTRPIPSTWYEIEVQETLKGKTGDKITVVRTNPGFSDDIQVTAMSPGELVLMFLHQRTSDDFPLVTLADVFYVPVSFDNGVFDVLPCDSGITKETRIRPRVSGLLLGGPFSLGHVRKMINDSAGLTLEDYKARPIVMTDYFGNHPFPIDRCESEKSQNTESGAQGPI